MDANIAVLEIRATNGWRRYGKLAAIGAAALASAVAGLIVWRKSRLARPETETE